MSAAIDKHYYVGSKVDPGAPCAYLPPFKGTNPKRDRCGKPAGDRDVHLEPPKPAEPALRKVANG